MTDDENPTTETDTYEPPPDAERKGYAVYDTTLGRYVGEVTADKPTAKDAKAQVPEGHDVEVRAV